MNKTLKIISKTIRILTIPPLTNIIMLILLYLLRRDLFNNITSIILMVIFIMIIPSLAYLIPSIIKTKENKRNKERKLAFIISLLSYTLIFLISLVFNLEAITKYITGVYFFSVTFLSIFNIFKIKASGHAASLTGPIFTVSYFININFLLPGIVIYLLCLFSSVYLKRHTIIEFILGTILCLLSAILSLIIFV